MSTYTSKPRPHSHRARRAPAPAPAPRHSMGPLSAATLSSFRCPSRQEFLSAFGGAPASVRARPRSFAGRVSRERWSSAEATPPDLACSEEADGEEEVATHLGAQLLDALDRLEETPELRAITCWLDDVRNRHNFPMRVTDTDLSNGIALLDVLYVIDERLFADVEYPAGADAPRPHVVRELDEAGVNAGRNRAVLRRALGKFAWRDIDDGGRALKGVDFDKVDAWGLGGFVVLAAYLSERGDEFAKQMMGYEEWVSVALEDVMCRGLEILGGRPRQAVAGGCEDGGEMSAATSTVSDATTTCSTGVGEEDEAEAGVYWRRRARDWERQMRTQERERGRAERRAKEAEERAQMWETAHAAMEREVARVTGELADAVAEVRRGRGRRGVLAERNGGREVRTVGKAVTQLRVDNAQLRRKVADMEKKNVELERELARVRREARTGRGRRAGAVGGGL